MVGYTDPPTAVNVPDWEEDKNSPHKVSGSSSYTVSISGSKDAFLIFVSDLDTTSSSGEDVRLQVNGDTGTNYKSITADGNSTTSSSYVVMGRVENASRDIFGTAIMSGRWVESWTLDGSPGSFSANMAQGARNNNVSSPLTQFTLFSASGSSFSATIEVWGRDTG